LSLLAAGLALLILLIASYSGRAVWIALGSATLSMAALVGVLFLTASQDPGQVRTGVAWLADQLSLVADRPTVDHLKSAVERLSTALSCEAGQKPGCTTAASADTPAAAPEAMQAAATTSWLEPKATPEPVVQEPPKQELAKQEPQKQEPQKQEPQKQEPWKQEPQKQEPRSASQSPVAWRLDDAGLRISSGGTGGFSVGGTNVSDKALEQIHAVLKPDRTQREMPLTLNVEGQSSEPGTTIPAGARFSLASETPNEDGSETSGGAILSFRYVQAGQHKSSIMYLTPATVARLANR
jgi:hypothetical protein